MDIIDKQQGTSSILHKAMCIISNPSVKSNLNYRPETLNSGQNWWLFVPRDLETWWTTLENNMTLLLYHFKLCASFQSHGWIQIGITVRKHSIRVKIGNKCPVWPDLEIWRMTLQNNLATLLCCFKLCTSLHSRWFIQAGVTVRKRPIWVKINDFF